MKKILLLLLLFLVSPVSAENAIPFCTSMTTKIRVRTKIGNPQYISLYSKEDFLKKAGVQASPYTLGLTVAKPNVSVSANPSIQELSGQICVALDEVELEIGYESLVVYIDKKYAPSSCEYQTIKEHENYHVQVAQQAIPFFKPDIERVASQAISKLTPKIVYSQNDIKPLLNKMVASIMKDVQPVLQHMSNKLAEKNAAIDTPEMYQATTAVCKDW